MLNQYNEADLAEIGFGISIIPLSSVNEPFNDWSIYKTMVAPVVGWHKHYQDQGSIGLVCGAVSDGLECLYINKVSIADSYLKIIPDDLQTKLVMIKTPGDGLYIIYRCPETVDLTQSLAVDSSGSVIISTIGEGNFFPLNRYQYSITQGMENFDINNLIAEVPVIKPYEKDILFQRAHILNNYKM